MSVCCDYEIWMLSTGAQPLLCPLAPVFAVCCEVECSSILTPRKEYSVPHGIRGMRWTVGSGPSLRYTWDVHTTVPPVPRGHGILMTNLDTSAKWHHIVTCRGKRTIHVLIHPSYAQNSLGNFETNPPPILTENCLAVIFSCMDSKWHHQSRCHVCRTRNFNPVYMYIAPYI